MIEQRLIDVANALCVRTGRRPREAFMRRAVSTAYYAVFHALCRMCADELIGGKHARTQARQRAYRALDHRSAKAVFRSSSASDLTPAMLAFGRVFVDLQQRRHEADYEPSFFPFFFSETVARVEMAEDAIRNLYSWTAEERRMLATMLLLKQRQT
jgi:hypothetical protein